MKIGPSYAIGSEFSDNSFEILLQTSLQRQVRDQKVEVFIAAEVIHMSDTTGKF